MLGVRIGLREVISPMPAAAFLALPCGERHQLGAQYHIGKWGYAIGGKLEAAQIRQS